MLLNIAPHYLRAKFTVTFKIRVKMRVSALNCLSVLMGFQNNKNMKGGGYLVNMGLILCYATLF